jgi:hypothetical protein
MHRQLRGMGNQKTILMPIVNAMDQMTDKLFTYKISDDDLETL